MSSEKLVNPQEDENRIDLFPILAAIWLKRKMIISVVGLTSILAVGISLVLQESFLATAVILPETDKSKISSMGGLSDLASLAGVNVGSEGSLVKLYPTILKSEAVLKNVVYKKYQTKKFQQPVNLIEYFGIEAKTTELQYETALKSLRGLLLITMDNKTSVITLNISMPEPQLAADILNEVTSELDKFIRNKRTTSASEQRKFVQSRLVEVRDDLTGSENLLKEFREKNRQVLSPQLLLEQERLIRDVQINATIYTELRKQFELVKIEEVKNIPVINIMDPARAPAHKDKPKRADLVLTITFFSFISVVSYVVVLHQYGAKITGFLIKFRLLK